MSKKKKPTEPAPSLGDLIPVMNEVTLNPEASELEQIQAIGDVGDKLDAIEWQALSWEEEAAKFERWFKPFQTKARTLRKAADWLRGYVKIKMIEGDVSVIPGKFYKATLQACADIFKIDRPASSSDWLNPETRPYVIQDISYRWDEDAIKKDLDEGKTFSFARFIPNRALHVKPQTSLKEIEK